MSFQSRPTQDGIYRIKVLDQNLYLESIPQAETSASTPWMQLNAPTTSKKQEWLLIKVPNSANEWTIASNVDQAGLIYMKTDQTYRGHGFPYPGGESLRWMITEYNGLYSKFSTYQNGSDVFDSQYRSQGDNAVHFWTYSAEKYKAPLQCFVFEPVGGGSGDTKLDVVFIQDATGSQQPYINAVRDTVTQICLEIKQEGNFQSDDDLRFGLIAFRDHPPQDTTFVTKPYEFTSNITAFQANLASLTASGGGDGPEAQCDALDDALNAAWRDEAAKVVILITDSPPHGVEDVGDGFPDGCPLQNDPVRTVQLMADAGITLNVIPCEPTLSSYYDNAIDFYRGLVAKTDGEIIPLGNAEQGPLQRAVFGLTAKMLDRARLAAQHQSTIQHQAFVQNRDASDIAADLHKELASKGVRHYAVKAQDVYAENEQGARNAQTWADASSLKEAKAKIQKVQGERIVQEHRGSGTYEVESKKEAITRDNVNSIVRGVLRKANAKK